MIYEVINPSDAVTIESDDKKLAMVATLYLGEGHWGLQDEDGVDTGVPFLLFDKDDTQLNEWLKSEGINDLGEYLDANLLPGAEVLESAMVASVEDRKAILATCKATGGDLATAVVAWNEAKRTSLNDICGRAHSLAAGLRRKQAKLSVEAESLIEEAATAAG